MTSLSKIALSCLAATLLLGTTAWGQNPNYTLSLTDATSADPGTATVSVILDNVGGAVEAWSYSICHDDNLVRPFASQVGADVADLNNDGGPDFYSTVVGFSDGLQVIAILDFFSMRTLPPGTGFELATIDYSTFGPVGTTTDVSICNTVGDPPTETLVVVNVVGEVPITNSGTITIGFQDPDPPTGPRGPGGPGGPGDPPGEGPGDFTFQVADDTVGFDGTTGAGSFSAALIAFETVVAGEDALGTQAFSTSVGHDPAVLAVTAVNAAPVLSALNGGAGPDFFQATLFSDGWNIGSVYNFIGLEFIVVENPTELIIADYETNASALAGATGDVMTDLFFTELGAPGVFSVMVTPEGMTSVSNYPTLVDGTITLSPGATMSQPFMRGDANVDATIDIADPVQLLGYLFQNSGPLPCADAADANNDQAIDIADGIFLLTRLFDNGPAPAMPFPDCGLAATGGMGCLSYTCP